MTEPAADSATTSSYELLFGSGTVSVDIGLPASSVMEISKPEMPPVEGGPFAAVEAALAAPVGGLPTLTAAVEAGSTPASEQTACIVICDITRPVPNGLLLPRLLAELKQAGVAPANVTVLNATGLHRPNESSGQWGDERAMLLTMGDGAIAKQAGSADPLGGGVGVVAAIDSGSGPVFANHDAKNDAEHLNIGTAKQGTKFETSVFVDKRFIEADIRVCTGLVEPHFMAGYSGGRKVISPGIAGEKTIRSFHHSKFMSHPLATQCNLVGNPLHETQLEVVKFCLAAGTKAPIYGLNVVIDEHRNLSFVSFGDIVASHDSAVAFAGKYVKVAVPRQYSTIVTSSAGLPLDKTYYQTVKGMVTCLGALAPGGDIIMVSEMSEKIGSEEFQTSQAKLNKLGIEEFMKVIMEQPAAEIDEWETEMLTKAANKAGGLGNIYLYSPGLTAAEKELTGLGASHCLETTDQLNAVIAASIARQPADSNRSVAVIAEGPYVVPVFTVPKLPRACGGILQAGSPWHDDELMDPSWIILRARGGPSPQHRDSFVP